MVKPTVLAALLLCIAINTVCAAFIGSRDDGEDSPDMSETILEIPTCYRAWKSCKKDKRHPPPSAVTAVATRENIGHLQSGSMNISFDMEWRSPEERVRALLPHKESAARVYWVPRDHWMRVVYAKDDCIQSWHCRIQCSDDILQYAQRIFVGDIEEPIDVNPGNYCHSSDKYNDDDQLKDLWFRYGDGHIRMVMDDCEVTNHAELIHYATQGIEYGHKMAFCVVRI